jgi:hypothetical protein
MRYAVHIELTADGTNAKEAAEAAITRLCDQMPYVVAEVRNLDVWGDNLELVPVQLGEPHPERDPRRFYSE